MLDANTLALIFVSLMGLSILLYAVLDGFDFVDSYNVGILCGHSDVVENVLVYDQAQRPQFRTKKIFQTGRFAHIFMHDFSFGFRLEIFHYFKNRNIYRF